MSSDREQRVSAGDGAIASWSRELLLRLDWKRYQDLVRVLVTKAGYRAAVLGIGSGGMGLMALSWGRGGSRSEALLCCAAWDRPAVDGQQVRAFHHEVAERGFPCGTMFTPGRFQAAALEFRGDYPLELIGGDEFLEVVGRLPREESHHLLKLTTSGAYDVPTCPTCSVKTELREVPAGPGGGGRQVRDGAVRPLWVCQNYPGCGVTLARRGAPGDGGTP